MPPQQHITARGDHRRPHVHRFKIWRAANSAVSADIEQRARWRRQRHSPCRCNIWKLYVNLSIGAYVTGQRADCAVDDVLDILLDQEGLEIDEIDRMEQDTPLHKAVRYVNSLDKAEWAGAGHPIVEILLDAGCDPRIRNKAKLKPIELADPRNTELRSILQKGEFAMQAGGDVVEEDEDEGPTGSASDSD